MSFDLNSCHKKSIDVHGKCVSILENEKFYISPYTLFFLKELPFFKETDVICDFGTGTGALGIAAGLNGSSRVYLIDSSQEALSLAKINTGINDIHSEFVFHCSASVPLLANYFDWILCNPASLPIDIVGNRDFCNGGELGLDMIWKTLSYASVVLKPTGKLRMLLSSILPLSLLNVAYARYNFGFNVIGSILIPFRNHYQGIKEWVDLNSICYPEMYYLVKDETFYEEVFMYEIYRREFI